MANVYQAEGNFENALTLYMKFTTLFLEKIRKHPEYKSFDPVAKRLNLEKMKEVFPIAERLKAKLSERFQHEYEEYEKQKQAAEREKEAASAAAAQKQKEMVRSLATLNIFPFFSNCGNLTLKLKFFRNKLLINSQVYHHRICHHSHQHRVHPNC